mmetsp:Transcript_11976/g.43742  ORF Transcript_11976/g.43742 Transcript_11976/m.43742 type:complete len:523 (-) Transcript_11976:1955-3523(-)
MATASKTLHRTSAAVRAGALTRSQIRSRPTQGRALAPALSVKRWHRPSQQPQLTIYNSVATESGYRSGTSDSVGVLSDVIQKELFPTLDVPRTNAPKLPALPEDTHVVVTGATGYIGRAVVKELLERGYQVTCVCRPRSGIGGAEDEETVKKRFSGADVVFSDVCDEDRLYSDVFSSGKPVHAVICCLASRDGGIKDVWKIDYQASLNCLNAARRAGSAHFTLLSAICVQNPVLELHRAKLAFEERLQLADDINYSIVRPTAYFKSLVAQIKLVKDGGPYALFANASNPCKAIAEDDLAEFMVNTLHDTDLHQRILPIGGPGPAMDLKDQGEVVFEALGRKPWWVEAPLFLFDGFINLFTTLDKAFPGKFADAAEFSRIGKFYAVEPMLVLDPNTGRYAPELTPEFGTMALTEFLKQAAVEENGMEGQDLGDQAIFGFASSVSNESNQKSTTTQSPKPIGKDIYAQFNTARVGAVQRMYIAAAVLLGVAVLTEQKVIAAAITPEVESITSALHLVHTSHSVL